ncbi:MAG TPA: cytochrome b/b6 domain-containing protein [Puia sp.]|uniref:cytochrome b/b6 domain-containing protein n=1 Tax=Puia sp. TaxID=2045100 RepID=UPI002C991480|nr:cytochrome b/b6 domain-containing protein [Puia sp.]HVU99531.1 cytochrome b/b6 domain-containing protein [Puia sp.]
MVSCRIKRLDLNINNTLDLRQRHSAAIRIWHWSFFLILTASLATVGLASTLFRTRNNIASVQTQLQKKGVAVNPDQARAVAHEFNDKLWGLHTWLGYILCFFVVVRIVIEWTQPSAERLGRRLKAALTFKPSSPQERGEQQHYLLVKRSYLVFYAAIAVMALTGLVLAFENVTLFKEWRAPVKQLHAFVQYVIYGYVLLHLAGVIRADIGQFPGIVSGMINGRKSNPQ